MTLPTLDARLLSVAEFVREGAYVADIGTDHAYLPVYLVLTGRAAAALASDINEGPVLRAKQSVERYGVSGKIAVELSPGLDAAEHYPVTDIIVAGMGGELIASIIDNAKWTRNEKYRLILQPMTHAEILRAYLMDNGFEIKDETVATPEGDHRIYNVICAEYIGGRIDYTDEDIILGRRNIEKGGEGFLRLCKKINKTNSEIKRAKESAGGDAAYEAGIVALTERYL